MDQLVMALVQRNLHQQKIALEDSFDYCLVQDIRSKEYL